MPIRTAAPFRGYITNNCSGSSVCSQNGSAVLKRLIAYVLNLDITTSREPYEAKIGKHFDCFSPTVVLWECYERYGLGGKRQGFHVKTQHKNGGERRAACSPDKTTQRRQEEEERGDLASSRSRRGVHPGGAQRLVGEITKASRGKTRPRGL